jgi:uncharacterized membrane protein YhiD involved in acid resistance
MGIVVIAALASIFLGITLLTILIGIEELVKTKQISIKTLFAIAIDSALFMFLTFSLLAGFAIELRI